MRSAPFGRLLPLLSIVLLGLSGGRSRAQEAETRAPGVPVAPVVEGPGLSARVRGSPSGNRLERSAEAVDVVDTGAAKRGTADLRAASGRRVGSR